MCESFFATLECELLERRHFKTQIEARMAIFEFIEGLCEMHDENLAKLIAIPEEGRRIEG
jgi:Integrase core domain